MSTRSTILVTGRNRHRGVSTTRLYKHSDGYPTGNLPVILEALENSFGQCLRQRMKFSEKKSDPINQSQVVGNIIGAAVTVYGMGASIDSDGKSAAEFEGPLKPEHFGDQGDLEWVYVLDIDKAELRILDGDQELANPYDYVDQLIKDAQAEEREETTKLIAQIEELGVAVVYKGKTKPKSEKATPKHKVEKSNESVGTHLYRNVYLSKGQGTWFARASIGNVNIPKGLKAKTMKGLTALIDQSLDGGK